MCSYLFSLVLPLLPVLISVLSELGLVDEAVFLPSVQFVLIQFLVTDDWQGLGVICRYFLDIMHSLGLVLMPDDHEGVDVLFEIGEVLLDGPVVDVHVEFVVFPLLGVLIELGLGQLKQGFTENGLDLFHEVIQIPHALLLPGQVVLQLSLVLLLLSHVLEHLLLLLVELVGLLYLPF